MRRFFSLCALLFGVTALSTSCTMPDSHSGHATRTSYPKIVETQQGASMLGGDHEGSGWDNATRGVNQGD